MKKILFMILLIIHCSTSPSGRRRIVYGVTDTEINLMGIKVFNDLKSKAPIESNQKINNYILCVTNSILKFIDTENKGWEIVVLKDANPNAFAVPGGKMIINSGILKITNTDDELATVLGHEIGHIMAEHSKESMSHIDLMEKAMEIVNNVTDDNEIVQEIMNQGAKYLIVLPFSRLHELEADELGMVYMSKAGFDPRESIQFWKKFALISKSQSSRLFSTHPSDESRIKNLENKMDKAIKIYNESKLKGINPSCSL